MELKLPFPKSEEKMDRIIAQVKKVFDKRNEAKELMRDVLLSITPVHRFDEDSTFLTLT